MSEKFLSLSKNARWIIIVFSCLLTVACFVSSLMFKNYLPESFYWLEVLLTLVGLFFCIITICLVIIHLSLTKEKDQIDD